jgi:hypothetical protein
MLALMGWLKGNATQANRYLKHVGNKRVLYINTDHNHAHLRAPDPAQAAAVYLSPSPTSPR